MKLLSTGILAALLVAGSAGLIVSHVLSWRIARRREMEEPEFRFRHGQYRRRMQASTILCLVSAGLFFGVLIDSREYPSFFVFYWFGIAMLVLWVALLAVWDMFAIRSYYGRIRQQRRVEELRLKSELDRRRQGANGHRTASQTDAETSYDEENDDQQ